MPGTRRTRLVAPMAALAVLVPALSGCTGPATTAGTATASARPTGASTASARPTDTTATGTPMFWTGPVDLSSSPGAQACPPPPAQAGLWVDAHDLMAVDPSPSGVIERWLTAFDATACVVVQQRGAAVATRLADAIRDAPSSSFNSGVFNCPFDSGNSIELYFTYPGRAEPELAVVLPTGCSVVTAPGRLARDPNAVFALLEPDAPATWSALPQ